jgi:predicted PilT family ATPase
LRPHRTLPAAASALALASLGLAPQAAAEETVCRGSMGRATVDNLVVPQGARCILTRTIVQGTLQVERDATLGARRVRVTGNVHGENARRVNVIRSRVGGSVQVKQGAAASVRNSVITHDIQYDANRSALRASRNRVGGSIQVFQNTGGVLIASNRVDGNLQCKENAPPPRGSGNVVQGVKEDQCAGL